MTSKPKASMRVSTGQANRKSAEGVEQALFDAEEALTAIELTNFIDRLIASLKGLVVGLVIMLIFNRK